MTAATVAEIKKLETTTGSPGLVKARSNANPVGIPTSNSRRSFIFSVSCSTRRTVGAEEATQLTVTFALEVRGTVV